MIGKTEGLKVGSLLSGGPNASVLVCRILESNVYCIVVVMIFFSP